MPELPEVQTTASGLQELLPKLTILDVWTDAKSLFRNGSFADFRKQVQGKTILSVTRRGKNILINLSGGHAKGQASKTILVHLKMTGHLMVGKWKMETPPAKGGVKWKGLETGPIRDDPYNRFIHIVFTLSNKKQLALSDMRKFAKVLVYETEKLDCLKDIEVLGIDPFDKNFTIKKFSEIFKGKKGKIKALLLRQDLVAGIGNIYADEILWQAGIHPARETANLSAGELASVYKAIKPILKKAIKAGGSSNSDYRNVSGNKGNFQNMQKAYRQTGKPCAKGDGGIIARAKVAGRSSHFCPAHQRL